VQIGDLEWRLMIALAIGDWRLAIAEWRLAIGDWRIADCRVPSAEC